MTYSIHPEAKEEFKRAFARYETNQEGLGAAFSDEFYATLDRVLSFLTHGRYTMKMSAEFYSMLSLTVLFTQ